MMTQNRLCGYRCAKRSGAAVVEAALIIPIIFLIILGTTEICNRIFLDQSLEVMAYEGARIALVPDSTELDVEMQVNEVGQVRRVDNVTVDVQPADYQTQPMGTFISVTVTADGNQSCTIGLFGSRSSSATVSMMKEY